MDNKLADFKADVRQAQDNAAAKAVSRVRHEKSYPYKKKSHEEQARFNNEVEQCIHEAQEGMAAVEESPALKRAKEALEKGARLLTERQKLIKIADRSENGWGVVAEYTADELADDSDDEKRLEKAEKAAERKAGLKKRKRALQPNKQPVRFQRQERQYGYSYPPPQWKQQQAVPTVSVASARRVPTPVPRAVGPCFACGEMGHLRSNWMQTPEKKWYPNMPRHESVSVKNVCAVQI